MTTIAEVLAWNPGQLVAITDTLLAKKRDLVDLQDSVDGARPPLSWYGSAADNARVLHEGLRLRLLDIVAEVGKVAASVDFAEVEVKDARNALQDVLDSASSKGFTVDHQTGTVTDPQTYDDEGAADTAAAQLQQVVQDLSTALTRAQTADQDLADALLSVNDGLVDGGFGDLDDAALQLPGALEDMDPAQIALRYADDVALSTVRAWIDAELEILSFELEGGAEAKYVILGNGQVVMSLHLEGGLGREIDVGSAGEVEASFGLTTDLDLTFDSPAEADAFLDGFTERAFDMEWYEVGNAPAHVARNVAEYIAEQDVTSFRTGIYGQLSGEVDLSWASASAEGRVDGYYDWVKEEYGVRLSANVAGETGGADNSAYSASAGLSGEAKLDSDGQLQEVTFSGSISGSVANEHLGLDLPDTSTGVGADVEVKMDRENPYFDEFEQATTSGDLDQAAALALEHGRVVVRATAIEELASGEHDVSIAGQGVEIEYGANAEVADQVWIRPAGQYYVIPLDPQEIER